MHRFIEILTRKRKDRVDEVKLNFGKTKETIQAELDADNMLNVAALSLDADELREQFQRLNDSPILEAPEEEMIPALIESFEASGKLPLLRAALAELDNDTEETDSAAAAVTAEPQASVPTGAKRGRKPQGKKAETPQPKSETKRRERELKDLNEEIQLRTALIRFRVTGGPDILEMDGKGMREIISAVYKTEEKKDISQVKYTLPANWKGVEKKFHDVFTRTFGEQDITIEHLSGRIDALRKIGMHQMADVCELICQVPAYKDMTWSELLAYTDLKIDVVALAPASEEEGEGGWPPEESQIVLTEWGAYAAHLSQVSGFKEFLGASDKQTLEKGEQLMRTFALDAAKQSSLLQNVERRLTYFQALSEDDQDEYVDNQTNEGKLLLSYFMRLQAYQSQEKTRIQK